MRRLVVLVLTALVLVTGSACDPELSRKASGTFTGTTTFQFGADGCSFVHQVFEGTWIRREGALGGTFEIEGCVRTGSEFGFTFDGTFLMVTQGGSELRGTVTGTLPNGSCPADWQFVMTLREGTKRYSGATGTIWVDGVWDCTTGPFMGPNPFNGTITAVIESSVVSSTGDRLALR